MAWRLATAITTYRDEVNARWPRRDKRSDGTIGDAAHASRSSDHNPWVVVAGIGVVRACDVDKDLTGASTDSRPASEAVDAIWLSEHLRALGKAGDPRLIGGGYIIWNGRISSETAGWAWRPYSGPNAHKHHLHLSVSRNARGFDSTASWGIRDGQSQEDDLNPDQVAQLARIESKLDEVLTQLYGPRPNGKIEGWPQLGKRTLVDAIAGLPKDTAKAVVAEPVGNALTLRKGVLSEEPITLGQGSTRGAEASVVRQRNEAAQVKK